MPWHVKVNMSFTYIWKWTDPKLLPFLMALSATGELIDGKPRQISESGPWNTGNGEENGRPRASEPWRWRLCGTRSKAFIISRYTKLAGLPLMQYEVKGLRKWNLKMGQDLMLISPLAVTKQFLVENIDVFENRLCSYRLRWCDCWVGNHLGHECNPFVVGAWWRTFPFEWSRNFSIG